MGHTHQYTDQSSLTHVNVHTRHHLISPPNRRRCLTPLAFNSAPVNPSSPLLCLLLPSVPLNPFTATTKKLVLGCNPLTDYTDATPSNPCRAASLASRRMSRSRSMSRSADMTRKTSTPLSQRSMAARSPSGVRCRRVRTTHFQTANFR